MPNCSKPGYPEATYDAPMRVSYESQMPAIPRPTATNGHPKASRSVNPEDKLRTQAVSDGGSNFCSSFE